MAELTNKALQLKQLLNELPAESVRYITRFTLARVGYTDEAFTADLTAELANRQRAQKLAQHREEKVMQEFLKTEVGQKNREVIAEMIGVAGTTASGEVE